MPFVLIIGESHSRNHSSIYGYARKTNPLLEKINSNFFVFDNVISPANTTVLCLQKMLSFATIKNPNLLYTQPSLLDIYNKVGYKTWWISNQQISGKHDTWSKLYGQKAATKYFINTTNSWTNYSFDENLFPYFDTALHDAAKNKFIVLHLIGSHERADKRYTSAYNVFMATMQLPKAFNNISSDDKAYINYYDNSVLYNDFILNTLITKAQATKQKICLLYVSDHGEEVCEQTSFHGHNEGVTSKYMCEVPFFVWMSSSFINNATINEIKKYIHRPFQTDELLSSILDVTSIRTPMYDSTKSVFSKYFIPSKRYINSLDYDSLYHK